MNSEQMKQLGIKEVFLPIDDFPNYEVSNYGNVRNSKTGKNLKGCLDIGGYYQVSLCDGGYNNPSKQRVHKLVLLAFQNRNNEANKMFVDHIDNNRSNNCIFNLRYVTGQENNFNSSKRSDNTSGYKGVHLHKKLNKWRSVIYINGKCIHIGLFDNIEDAKQARQNKARELFGEYINKCEL